jgi:hypothetical protein
VFEVGVRDDCIDKLSLGDEDLVEKSSTKRKEANTRVNPYRKCWNEVNEKQFGMDLYLCELKLYNVHAASVTMSMETESKQTGIPSADHIFVRSSRRPKYSLHEMEIEKNCRNRQLYPTSTPAPGVF